MISTASLDKLPVAHMIYDAQGELSTVTLDDTEAEMADMEGLSVTTNATAEDIVEEIAPLAASDYMSDKTWQAIAPAIKALAGQREQEGHPYDREPILMGPTSPELPEEIINARMSALSLIFDQRFDLQAYVELQELSFANNGNRKANQELFTEESWKSNWNEIYQEDPDDLEQRAIAIHEMMAEHASEAAMFGDGPVGSFRKDVLGRLDEKEIDFVMESRITEDEKVNLGDQDVPY